jgi:hypothetical protein
MNGESCACVWSTKPIWVNYQLAELEQAPASNGFFPPSSFIAGQTEARKEICGMPGATSFVTADAHATGSMRQPHRSAHVTGTILMIRALTLLAKYIRRATRQSPDRGAHH